MSQRFQTLNLLDSIMSGNKVSPDELDTLINERVPEDLYLDYKHAAELNDRKKASRTIRQYVSGFANSAGGVLIIGIDENEWKITPCQNIISGSLFEWASRCLTEIAHYFSPVPRIQVVEHQKGDVLVIATSRTVGLVPCKEKGELVYYLRFHDQKLDNKTLKVPEYLVADLMLGRKNRPYLTLNNLFLTPSARETQKDPGRMVEFGIIFNVENGSLSWANDVKIGIVCYTGHQAIPLSDQLLSYLDIKDLDLNFGGSNRFNIYHKVIDNNSGMKINLDPFSILKLSFGGINIPIRIQNQFHDYNWKATIYIMSRETPPIWYQLNLKVNNKLLVAANNSEYIYADTSNFEVMRLTNERAVIDWEEFGKNIRQTG